MGTRTGVGGRVVVGPRLLAEAVEILLDSKNMAFFSASVNGTDGPIEDLGLEDELDDILA